MPEVPNRPMCRLERLARQRHERDLELARHPGGHPKGFTFDEAAGERVIFFIEHYCRHWKGEWAGQLIKLEPWQKWWIGVLFGWKRADGTRRFRKAWVEINRKNAKELDVATPIPTPSGWTTMGDLQVGDVVFDERGEPCRVTLVTPIRYDRPSYRVAFSDGTSIVADPEHLWYTECRRTGLPRTGLGPKSSWHDRHIRTTEQIRATLHRQDGAARVEWNHRIPVARPLNLPAIALPIPPYTLGYWLGNGDSNEAKVTCDRRDADAIAAAMSAEGVATRERYLDPRSQSCRIPLVGIRRSLRDLELLGSKRIPAGYLRAGTAQRLALLRGLMDSDGTVSKAGQCSFATTSPALRDGALELLRSLGFKPTADEDRAILNGEDRGAYWRVQFWAYRGDEVFSLPRKAARLKPPPKNATRAARRQIVGVDPVPSVPMRCIQVDSPSHLYLAGAGMVPTHNTTIAAAIGLYMLVADNEPGAECYCTATAEEQAKILLRDAVEMVEASPELSEYVEHLRSKSGSLYCKVLRSRMAILSSESRTKDGLNPHADLRDEVHEWNDHDLAAKLDTAMGARRQPLTLEITTAGVYDKESVGWQHHEYAVQVLECLSEDDRLFVFIAAVDDDDDPLNEPVDPAFGVPRSWLKANPNWGVSCKPSFLQEQVDEARNATTKVNDVLRLHFGRWTAQVVKWLDVDRWKQCDPVSVADALAQREAREKALEGRLAYGGLDLSATADLTALVLVFPGDEGLLELLARFYLPEDTIARELKKKGRRHYRDWVDQGWIIATPGEQVDYAFIRRDVNALAKRYDVREWGFDPYNAKQLCGELLNEDGLPMMEVRQGPPSLSEPCKLFEAKILARKVRHGGHPVMSWCVGNAVSRSDANGNIAPDKKRAKDKIDGVSATVTALNRLVTMDPKSTRKRSYLESSGVIVV